jgi:adenosine tuberculosinyltransferase
MDWSTFAQLPAAEIAQLIRAQGGKVCVFPINGTRRWFTLEYPEEAARNFTAAYLDIAGRRHVELYRLFFDHGLDTLLTPIVGPDILQRDVAYGQILLEGLLWFAQNPLFLDFYDAYQVRAAVYGDARRYLAGTPYEAALSAFDELARRTAAYQGPRLFFGICAHDAAESVAAFGLRFFQEQGRLPDRREIVTAYYGQYVSPVDLFIGFERPSAFDMPLLATGHEDLYFTVAPSPYLEAETLRAILYDHLYTRRVQENYHDISPETWRELGQFYRRRRGDVLGVGERDESGQFWRPVLAAKTVTTNLVTVRN